MMKTFKKTKTGNINSPVIGLLGGMGSYATLDFFKRILDAYDVEKEWERPHVLIDNFCTMPSRVKAILTHEDESVLVECMVYSVSKMIDYGVDYIVFTCNTSHFFIPKVIEKIPNAKKYIVNMIEVCAEVAKTYLHSDIAVIGSEGTLSSGIYKSVLDSYGLVVEQPTQEEYCIMRYFIEAVKQNNIEIQHLVDFASYVNNLKSSTVILGCTEFPLLYDACIKNNINIEKTLIDPVECTINYIKNSLVMRA